MPSSFSIIHLAAILVAAGLVLWLRGMGVDSEEPELAWGPGEKACLAALLLAAGVVRLIGLEGLPPYFVRGEFVVAGTVHDLCNPDPGYLEVTEPQFPSWSAGSTRLASWLVRLLGGASADDPPAGGQAAILETAPTGSPAAASGRAPSPGVSSGARRLGVLRLANALFGLLLVLVVYMVLRELDGPAAAAAGGGFAALSPILTLQCRFALQAVDCSLLPLCFLLFALLGMRTRKLHWYFLSGLSLGLAMEVWAGGGAAMFALAGAVAAGLAVRRETWWPFVRGGAIPLLLGAAVAGRQAIGVWTGDPPPWLLGRSVQSTVLFDPVISMLGELLSRLALGLGAVLGQSRVETIGGWMFPAVVSACLAVCVLAPTRIRPPGARLLLTAYAFGAFIPSVIARHDTVGFRTFAVVLPLVFVAAGLGAAWVRTAVHRVVPILRPAVIPFLMLLAMLPWKPGNFGMIRRSLDREPFLAPLQAARRYADTHEVLYVPHHLASERVLQLESRAARYLEWAYGFQRLTPGVASIHRRSHRPLAFVVSRPEQLDELGADYPQARRVVVNRIGGAERLLLVSPEEHDLRLGWRESAEAPVWSEAAATLRKHERWTIGALHLPGAGLYRIRAEGRGEMTLLLGSRPPVASRGIVEDEAWFLEGYVPVAVGERTPRRSVPLRLLWKAGEDADRFVPIPEARVLREVPADPGAWSASSRDDRLLRVTREVDRPVAGPGWTTFETALALAPDSVVLLRWLPKPIWRVSPKGLERPLPEESAAGSYRVRALPEETPPPGAIAVDARGRIVLPTEDQRRLLFLSAEHPSWETWPRSFALMPPIALDRVPGADGLVVASLRRVHVLGPGTAGRSAWSAPACTDIAVAGDGRIFLLDLAAARIWVRGEDGSEKGSWRCSELTPGSRLTVDEAGRVWVLRPETGHLIGFSGDGGLIAGPLQVSSSYVRDTRGMGHREEPAADIASSERRFLTLVMDGRITRLKIADR